MEKCFWFKRVGAGTSDHLMLCVGSGTEKMRGSLFCLGANGGSTMGKSGRGRKG